MISKIKVLLLDDHDLVRISFRELLESKDNIIVVGDIHKYYLDSMRALYNYKNENILIYDADNSFALEIPFVKSGISAGFPSPADDFLGIKCR